MPRAHTLLSLLSLLTISLMSFGQSLIFSHSQYASKGRPVVQADLNSDGVLDIVTVGIRDSDGKNGFYVTLSNSDGSYQPPVFYTSPYTGGTGVVAVGDFNNDGKVDVVQVEQTTVYYVYLNNGDGTLAAPQGHRVSDTAQNLSVATADLNRDGKLDLIVEDASGGALNLRILLGDGSGGFAMSSSVASQVAADVMFIGDFDGDGKADLATSIAHCDRGAGCYTYVQVFYGNGTGGFSQMVRTDSTTDTYFQVAIDVNQDGKSDLVGRNGSSSSVRMLMGSSSRTLTVKDVPVANGIIEANVGDFDGNGIMDLAVLENVNGTEEVGVKLGNADGSYVPEQYVYNSTGPVLDSLIVGRYDTDRQADIFVRSALDASFNNGYFEFLHNNTGGNFPPCAPPNAARGIAICSPAQGSSTGSTVQFSVGAAFTSPLRKTEIWVDGVKKFQSFYGYASYAFLSTSIPMSSGTHTVEAYAVTYDGRVEKASNSFTVGGTSSGSCPVPSSMGVNICSPASGSTVDNPIHILASGRNTTTTEGMDVWLDGTKVGWYLGNTVDIQDNVSPGPHQLDIYAKATNGELQMSTSYFSVPYPGGTGCPAPTSAGAINMCSPVNGSTVSSPVHVTATGGSSVDTIEVWIDGNKIAQEVGAKGTVTFDLQFPMAAGAHRVHLNAKSSGVLTYGVTSYFTVQ